MRHAKDIYTFLMGFGILAIALVLELSPSIQVPTALANAHADAVFSGFCKSSK